jgi:hypothetical protein
MYIESRFPKANRVDIQLLQERYAFSAEHINEIKHNWIVDPKDSNIYCKPNSTYHKEIVYNNVKDTMDITKLEGEDTSEKKKVFDAIIEKKLEINEALFNKKLIDLYEYSNTKARIHGIQFKP